jgi:endonuclease G
MRKELLQSLVVPRIDADYSNRRGYDDTFLGVSVPMPALTRAGKAAAAVLDGNVHIPYEHFSVVLHRQRRMAIFTASNVDWQAKRPEGLTREKLSGLRANDTEKWATDQRIPAEWQLPDAFYTKDRQSFDKGHLVRRDDVCWGTTNEEIIRANGDTFHVTNCSPQRANFNRSVLDDHGWGDLENLIARNKDRYCVFAGPIFADDDAMFEGVDDRGATSVRIPSAFWKVVVDPGDGGKLEAHAFRLAQDLSDVKFAELDVTVDWKAEEVTIAALERELRLVRFPAEVRRAAG